MNDPRARFGWRVGLFAGLLGLGCCDATSCSSTTPPPPDVGTPPDVGGPTAAAVDDLYLAVMPLSAEVELSPALTEADAAALCEAPDPASGWVGSPVFSVGAGQPVPAALARFCRYRWEGADTPSAPPDFSGEPPATQPLRLDPDPRILVPQGPDSARARLGALRSAQAKRLLNELAATPASGASPAATPYAAGATATPYVAVVDTADRRTPPTALPTYDAAEGPQRHGLMMAEIISTVRCPLGQSACRDRVLLTQAFPYGSQPGQLGSVGSLATAVGDALVDWAAQPDADDAGLVINLSVAWEPDRDGDPTTVEDALAADHMTLLDGSNAESAPVQALHTALALSSCRGALTVAAAGNDRSRLCTQQGPMAPALWQTNNAPTTEDCQKYFGIVSGGAPAGSAPLVWAVGGSKADGQPIANARLASTPMRVMASDYAVTTPTGSAATEPWTGTSVATAALSGVAAQVWSHRPKRTARAVMLTIDNAGTPVGSTADLCLAASEPCGEVRRIDAHAAIEATLAPAPVLVGIANPYAPRDPSTAAADEVRDATRLYDEAVGQPNANSTTVNLPRAAAPSCGPGTSEAYGTDLRLDDDDSLSPAARPQPHIPLCPTCDVVRTQNSTGQVEFHVDLVIAPEYAGRTVDQPSLTLYDPPTQTTIVVTLEGAEPGRRVSLNNYSLGNNNTLSQWLEQHPQVDGARVGFRVQQQPSPQTVIDVVAVVR